MLLSIVWFISGYTALHYAARNGHLNVCRYLVEKGAHIDAATKSGQATSLHRACSAGKTFQCFQAKAKIVLMLLGKSEIVTFLLSEKADVALRDGDGKTALHRASENNHVEICEVLASRFPNLKDVADNKGNKPNIVI